MKKFIFLIVLVLCTWGFGLGAFTASVLTMKPENPGETTDVIIVLTGGKERIETGLQLFSEHDSKNLFITGVHEDVTLSEITSRHRGGPLPDCCISIGHKAESTRQNADEAREWLKDKNFKTIRLVTSNYHMPRAMLEFHHALPGMTIIPNPILQPDITPHHEYFWRLLVIEYHKIIFRFLDMLVEGIR